MRVTRCAPIDHGGMLWKVILQVLISPPYVGVDIVSGGPPCQSFSYAGYKRGFGDPRGTLFAEFARCVQETQPKMFIFENVKGMYTHDKGRTFTTIKHTFEQLGYQIQDRILRAEYLGVGQKRHRLIMVGVRGDIADRVTFTYPVEENQVTTVGDVLQDVPDSVGMSYSARRYAVLDLVPPGGCWVNLPENVAKDYMGKSYYSSGGRRGVARRISWDEPCLTLTTSPSQKISERCHPDDTRPFTVREYARIQSFPDEWGFTGSVQSQYKQIGNAVPVELARRVGVSVVDALTAANLSPGVAGSDPRGEGGAQ